MRCFYFCSFFSCFLSSFAKKLKYSHKNTYNIIFCVLSFDFICCCCCSVSLTFVCKSSFFFIYFAFNPLFILREKEKKSSTTQFKKNGKGKQKSYSLWVYETSQQSQYDFFFAFFGIIVFIKASYGQNRMKFIRVRSVADKKFFAYSILKIPNNNAHVSKTSDHYYETPCIFVFILY